MDRHTRLWKRITGSLMLLVFAFSAVGGAICTGHRAAHAGTQTGWAVAVLAGPALHEDAVDPADHRVDESALPGGHHAVCDAPVFLAASGIAVGTGDLSIQPSPLDAPALLDTVAAERALPPDAARGHPPGDGRTWPYQDPFAVTARLRL